MNFLFTFIGYYLLSHFLHYLNFHCVRMLHAKSLQSCPTPWDPLDCSPPGSSVQARILEWVTMPSSRGSSWPSDWTQVSRIAGRFFTFWITREAQTTKNINYTLKFFSLVKLSYYISKMEYFLDYRLLVRIRNSATSPILTSHSSSYIK